MGFPRRVSALCLINSTLLRICFFLRGYSICIGMYANYLCDWRILTRSLIMLIWSDHSGNAIQTHITHTLHILNIFQQIQAVLSQENLWIICSEQDLLFEDVSLAFLIILCKIPLANCLFFGMVYMIPVKLRNAISQNLKIVNISWMVDAEFCNHWQWKKCIFK